MLTKTWKARLFRLWLVIALPLACWTAYEAWDAYQRADHFQGEAEFWLERARVKAQDQNIFDPDTSTATSKRLKKSSAEDRAFRLTWITSALIALPLIGLILLKIWGWVWVGSSTSQMERSK